MKTYIVRRLMQLVPVLFITSALIFLILRLIPGDPAHTILGPEATREQVEALRREMGLDEPLPVQYLIWLGHVGQGNLGNSFINDFPVLDLILLKLPVTLELTAVSLTFALLTALLMGILPAIKPTGWLEGLSYVYNTLGLAVPTLWLGLILMLVFGLQLRILPPSGYVSLWSQPIEGLKHLILPGISLSVYTSAILARFMKTSLLETLNADYIRTARSKGLVERIVITRHALKNALIPVVTMFGIELGYFIGGAVITESIFDLPGIGRMLLRAILTRDYSVVQGTFLFIVVAFMLINLLTDITYAFLDPRIRYS